MPAVSKWAKAKIGDLIDDRIALGLPDGASFFRYIDISAVDNATKRIVSPRNISVRLAPSRARQRVRTGDVLVATTRPNLNAVALVPAKYDGDIASTGFAVLRPLLVDANWLYTVVQSRRFVRNMTRCVRGALYPAIRPSDVHEYSIDLPTLSDQRRIGRKIGTLLEQSRALDDSFKTIGTQIQLCRSAVLDAAFDGRLTASSRSAIRARADYQDGRALLKEIMIDKAQRERATQKTKTPDLMAGIEMFGPQKKAPSGWATTTVGELIYGIEAGTSFRCLPRPAKRKEWGIIKVSAMSWGTFDQSENKCLLPKTTFDGKNEIHAGDILLSRSNTSDLVGANVIVERTRPRLLLSDKSLRLKPSIHINKEWFHFALSSPTIRRRLAKMAGGSSGSMLNIGQSDIMSTLLCLPPKEEQRLIAEEVKRRLDLLAVAERQVLSAASQLAALKTSLIDSALSGKLIKMDREAEHASSLLKRIKAMKQKQSRHPQKLPRRRKTAVGQPSKADELLKAIVKQFGTDRFTSQQLQERIQTDYEDLKLMIFEKLSRRSGCRLEQIFHLGTKTLFLQLRAS